MQIHCHDDTPVTAVGRKKGELKNCKGIFFLLAVLAACFVLFPDQWTYDPGTFISISYRTYRLIGTSPSFPYYWSTTRTMMDSDSEYQFLEHDLLYSLVRVLHVEVPFNQRWEEDKKNKDWWYDTVCVLSEVETPEEHDSGLAAVTSVSGVWGMFRVGETNYESINIFLRM